MVTIERMKADESFAERLNDSLVRARKPLLVVLVVLIAVVVALVAGILVVNDGERKGLSQLDDAYFTLTNDAGNLSDEELFDRENTALSVLSALSGRGGVVGVRANLLMAEIQFQRQDYAAARAAWLSAADAKKGAYTAPLAYFNAAVCSENLGDAAAAVQYYTAAADAKDFLLVDHALFSLGRVHETNGDFAAAKVVYERLTDAATGSSWTNLAKTRLLALQATGSIE